MKREKEERKRGGKGEKSKQMLLGKVESTLGRQAVWPMQVCSGILALATTELNVSSLTLADNSYPGLMFESLLPILTLNYVLVF